MVRAYDFLTGYDQTPPPTASLPALPEELATIQFGVLNYATFIDSIANAKQVGANYRAANKPMFVAELLAWFYFDAASSATGDDQNIIQPTFGTGRWHRIPIKGFGSSSDVATSATINALSTSTPVIRLTGSTTTEIRGAAAGIGEQILALYNASTAVVTLKHQNGSASANDRFALQQGRDLTLQPGGAALFRYDKTLTRWVPAAGAGSGSGGMGGIKVDWYPMINPPIFQDSDPLNLIGFFAGAGHQLFAAIKVPTGYAAGTQLNCRFQFTSPATSDTVLLRIVSTLIRAGTDAFTSTANQHTSSNTAVTLSAGTQNRPLNVTADITDSSGLINGQAVSPGDLIILNISRGTDTSTDEAYLIDGTSEVSE